MYWQHAVMLHSRLKSIYFCSLFVAKKEDKQVIIACCNSKLF